MKKIVALLLCTATILGCAACGKSEETTKKKKKKTKKTTKITETEETDEPSETPSSESETEPTDTQAPDYSDFVITHDLSSEEIKEVTCAYRYGAIDANDMENDWVYPKDICCSYEMITADGPLPVISSILEETIYHEAEGVYRVYQKELETFTGLQESGSELYTHTYTVNHDILRADSQIFSFSYRSYVNTYDSDEGPTETLVYSNYRVSDGTEIAFEDVILDTDAFKEYISQYYWDMGLDSSKVLLKIDEESFHSTITAFGLTYDGIIIDGVKVPVYGRGDIFNMSYFGSTPASYSLMLEPNHWLMWDFNNDGQMDKLGVSVTKSGYNVDSLTITMYGEEYTFNASDFEEMDWMEDISEWADSYVMSVDGNYFLLLVLDSEGEDYMTYVFDINTDKPIYTDCIASAPYDCLDPYKFHMDHREDVMGTLFYSFDYALTEYGTFNALSTMGRISSGVYITTIDMMGHLYDVTNGIKGDEFEIDGGTPVEIIGYDVGSGDLILRLHSKFENLDFIDVVVPTDKSSNVCGMQNSKAFLGLVFAD